MLRFRELKLAIKGYLLIAMAAISMSAIAGSAFFGLEQNKNQMVSISEDLVPQLDQLAVTDAAIKTAHMEIYRSLSWASAGVQGADLEAQLMRASQSLDVLKSMLDHHQSVQKNAILNIISLQLTEYISQARDAIDMAFLDSSAATVLANSVNRLFGKMDDLKIREMERQTSSIRRSLDEKSVQARRTQSIFVAIFLIALIATLTLTVLVIRSVTYPIHAMTLAMNKLANNELSIRIPCGSLKNEFGEMAKAVAIFRDNSIERIRLAEIEEKNRILREKSERDIIEDKAKSAQDAMKRAQKENAETELRANQSSLLQEEMARVIDAACHGDFSKRMQHQFDDTTLMNVVHAVNALISSVETSLAKTAEFLHGVARGDLGSRMDGVFEGAFKDLQDNSNLAAEKLGFAIIEILKRSASIHGLSEEIATAMGELSMRTEKSAHKLEQTSASLTEITRAVAMTAKGAHAAKAVVDGAFKANETSAAVVTDAINAMDEIERFSNEISKTVSIIDEVAFQTNLLALNAGVEAARAGDAGRGFTVVATEVRALAQRASQAAREIDVLIKSSSKQVQSGVDLVGKAGHAFSEMSRAVAVISQHVSEIAGSAQEQSANINAIDSAISDLDRMIQQNATMFEETTASNKILAASATKMNTLVAQFKTNRKNSEESFNNDIATFSDESLRISR